MTDGSRELRRPPLPSWLYRGGSLALYFVLTTALYGADLFNNSRIVTQANGDQIQEVWFLAWPAFALSHLLNPFHSTWMNHPSGVNLLANTSMPLLGLLAAPITWVFGPVVSYTVLLRLGMILSAASLQFVARRMGISRAAALAGGLMYGFSTMQLTQGSVHLFLTFAPLPPLIFYGVYCLLSERWTPRRSGLTVGALLSAEFLISAEQALIVTVALAVALCVTAVVYARQLSRAVLVRVATATAWTTATALLLLAIPLMQMNGRGHVSGLVHPWIQNYVTDLASLVLPGPQTLVHPFHFVESSALALRDIENGAYVGIALLGLLLWTLARGRKSRLIVTGTVATFVLLAMSLGRAVNVDGHATSLISPYAVAKSIPYLQNILPVRFMSVVWMGVAILSAWGFDQMAQSQLTTTGQFTFLTRRIVGAALVFALIAISLLPAHTYALVRTKVPSWIRSAEAAKLIPRDSTVLFYPFPLAESNHAMLDQAVTGFRFKIIGGEAIVGDGHSHSIGISKLFPSQLPSVFIWTWECLGNRSHKPLACLIGIPALDTSTTASFHEYVIRNSVSTIVMEDGNSKSARLAAQYLKAAFGSPLLRDGGRIKVWNHAMLER